MTNLRWPSTSSVIVPELGIMFSCFHTTIFVLNCGFQSTQISFNFKTKWFAIWNLWVTRQMLFLLNLDWSTWKTIHLLHFTVASGTQKIASQAKVFFSIPKWESLNLVHLYCVNYKYVYQDYGFLNVARRTLIYCYLLWPHKITLQTKLNHERSVIYRLYNLWHT